jgi:perosamine synthetase
MSRIPVAGPSITDKEIAYVADAARNAWYENANSYVKRFEAAFAKHLGLEFAISLPSCTSALHLSLMGLGVKAGDEVIVPDATWIASAAPISYVGATPVFADVDPRTWCLSAQTVAACITPRTRAIINVDLYGGLSHDVDAIRALAREKNIAVIEDAAEAIGSLHGNRPAGSLGDVGVFSFHGSKTVTTGEGGMLATARKDLRDRIAFLRDHGRAPGEKMFWNSEVAWKYKMSDVQAALGLAQLERLEDLVGMKRRLFAQYQEQLRGLPEVTLNYEAPGTRNSYWMITAVLDPALGIEKEQVIKAMAAESIDCRPFFYPLSQLPAYAALKEATEARARNQNAARLGRFGLNLPSALSLGPSEVGRVCDVLTKLLKR